MPNLKITPASALVTAGQAVTFQATVDNQAASVTWNLTPQVGSLFPAVPAVAVQAQGAAATGPLSSSVTYVAPSSVPSAQTVAVTATLPTESASVTVSLTPDAISIVPASVELHAKQPQKFIAMVASPVGDAEPITWILAPQVGTLSNDGLYTPPDTIPDNGALTVTAVSKQLGKQASAKVTLTPEPWRGSGPLLLGAYILLVFSVVYLMIALWPSEIPNIDALKADQAQAQATLDQRKLDLQKALGPATSVSTSQAGAPPGGAADTTTNTLRQQLSDAQVAQLRRDLGRANDDLDRTTKRLLAATSPTVETKLVKDLSREIDLLWLVLLAGAFGSCLHMAQSFSDFSGNRTLKSSWVWWYSLLPFVGAGLSVIIYAALRGGIITVGSIPTVKASDLNPFGLVAAGALAGMFSKAATTKLGEVFDTLFQSSKGQQMKDPLRPDSQGSSQPPKPGTAGGSAPAPTK
jgi:hypothetical protein